MKKITDCYSIIIDYIWENNLNESELTLSEFLDIIEEEISEEEKN